MAKDVYVRVRMAKDVEVRVRMANDVLSTGKGG